MISTDDAISAIGNHVGLSSAIPFGQSHHSLQLMDSIPKNELFDRSHFDFRSVDTVAPMAENQSDREFTNLKIR
jgi:hypothetical protein